MAYEKGALEVHPQHAIEIGFGEVEKVGGVNDAGIVDQDVEAAEARRRFVHQPGGVRRVADVGGDGMHRRAGVQRPRRAVQLVRVSRGDGDAAPAVEERARDGPPDAFRRAGHHRNFVRHKRPYLKPKV